MNDTTERIEPLDFDGFSATDATDTRDGRDATGMRGAATAAVPRVRHKIWKLFTGDVRRMCSNVVSIIIVIGLVSIPGLFSWFNIAASWNPFGDLDTTATTAQNDLTAVHGTLTDVSGKLAKAGKELGSFDEKLSKALDSGDMSMVKEVLGNNPETLSATLAAPVTLKRKAVFPVETFGSSLAPLYLLLPLWVGSLLMAVTLKTTVSRRVRRELGDPRPHQMYLGHYGIFGLLALLQSTFAFGGALLFIHVQAVHPLLFMLTGWVSSLVFSFFAYTMVVSFGNVGKAIGVLMLIVQISGSNAAYPLQMLPDWIGRISPMLPVTHSVTMIRAAIAGIYDMDYWKALGALLLFIPPLLLIGLLLRKPLVRFNQWYVAKVESTKIMA